MSHLTVYPQCPELCAHTDIRYEEPDTPIVIVEPFNHTCPKCGKVYRVVPVVRTMYRCYPAGGGERDE